MLRTGKMAISFVQNYLTETDDSQLQQKGKMRRPGEISNDKFSNNCKKLRALTKTLERAGGIFNKCAQLLSLYEEEKKVFGECIPFDTDKTTSILLSYFDNNVQNCKELIREISPAHFKSGSVGLIFRGTGNEDQDLILKIRYNNLYETTFEDLKIVETLVKYMYTFVDFNAVMTEIRKNVLLEMDFYNECAQHQILYNIWNNAGAAKIPKIYKKYCTGDILVSEYIAGIDMSELIARGSDEEKKRAIEKICYFIFKNLFHHNLLYSDLHYGNFIAAGDELYVVDFGCIQNIREGTVKLLGQLYFDILRGDDELIAATLENLGIIEDGISADSKNYLLKYIKFQYEPWISGREFKFTDEWLSISTDKNIEWMREWNLPSELVYFNKIPFGLYHILTKMNVPVNYGKIMRSVFDEK
jgi:predicted unusual protein kinase regulating ubiquinone biosynthesis (AarF/ABC1/UbiB family)